MKRCKELFRMKSSLSLLIVIYTFSLLCSGDAKSQECFESSILSPTPFMGNNGEIFKLDDDTVWEVKHEYEYLYEYYPRVIVCPSRGKLIVKKKSLNVELISSSKQKNENSEDKSDSEKKWEIFEETNLIGTISGTVQQGRIFKTLSGHVYEVTGVTIQVVVEVQPEVMVLKNGDIYKLVIKGFDEPLICNKLK